MAEVRVAQEYCIVPSSATTCKKCLIIIYMDLTNIKMVSSILNSIFILNIQKIIIVIVGTYIYIYIGTY